MRILIIGGAGFLGSSIAEMLYKNHEIRIYDNFRRDSLKYNEILRTKVCISKGDISQRIEIIEAMKNVDLVIHCAAIAGVSQYGKVTKEIMETNVIGTYNILNAMNINGVNKLIFLSTSEVMGQFSYRKKESDDIILGVPQKEMGRWSYAISKIASEYIIEGFRSDINSIVIRPYNIYGLGQTGEGAVKTMLIKALKDEDILIYGDGSQIRSWCYISDFLDGFNFLFNNIQIDGTYNIGNPFETVSSLELARKIIRITGSKSRIVCKEHPSCDVMVRVPNIDKIINEYGYHPKITLEEGIKKTAEWVKGNLL